MQVTSVGQAVAAARQAVADGADLLDIGGQSTRPNAARLDAATECGRIIPAIRRVRMTYVLPAYHSAEMPAAFAFAGLHNGLQLCTVHLFISHRRNGLCVVPITSACNLNHAGVPSDAHRHPCRACHCKTMLIGVPHTYTKQVSVALHHGVEAGPCAVQS